MKIKTFHPSGIPYSHDSLFFKSFIRLTCFVLVLVIIMSIAVFSTSFLLTGAEFKSTVSENVNKLNSRTEEVFSQMKDICNFLSLNESVRYFLLDSSDYPTTNLVHDKITLQLSQFSLMSPYIDSIYVYNPSNKSLFSKDGFYSAESFPDKDWISLCNSNDDEMHLYPRKMYNLYPYVITFIRNIRLSTGECGAIVLNLNTKKLFPELIDSQSASYITDSENKIIFSSQSDLFLLDADKAPNLLTALNSKKSTYSKIYSRSPHSASVSKENAYGMRCVCILDISGRINRIFLTQSFLIVCCVILLLIAIFFVYRFTISYYTPFAQIRKLLDTPANPGIEPVDAETKYIAKRIIETMNANEALRSEINNFVEQTAKLRIYSMQCQLNPHFLYNTMNIITLSLVKKLGMLDDSIEIMDKLSLLMRYTMDLSEETTTVQTEIKYTKLYTDILKIRNGKDLQVKWNIDNSILNASIPRLCFQPLIENAFSHGLAPSSKSEKTLTVSGKRSENLLIFTIEDNGVGIPTEKFVHIKEKLETNDSAIGLDSHIGINNVNSRIKLIFGDEYGLDIESTPDIGTKLFIKLPYIEKSI